MVEVVLIYFRVALVALLARLVAGKFCVVVLKSIWQEIRL